METLIICSLLLALTHIWLLPMALNLKHMEYLLSNREAEVEQSAMSQRVLRASVNFQESLPAFLVLCVLSMIQEVDNSSLAMYWIVLRALYLVSYTAGIIYVRTLLWIGSLVCLIMMALSFT